MPRPFRLYDLANERWRRAMRELHSAEQRFENVYASSIASEQARDRAWLVLWRAEQGFQRALDLADDWRDPSA